MLDEPRQAQLGQLLPERARGISAHRESIARHLHGDGAESLAGAAGFEIGGHCAEESAPVESAMLEEASILSCDEGILDEVGHALEADIDSSHQLEASHQAVVA